MQCHTCKTMRKFLQINRNIWNCSAINPVGIFCSPGSRSGFHIRIQIHGPDWIRIQSSSETLGAYHWFRIWNWIAWVFLEVHETFALYGFILMFCNIWSWVNCSVFRQRIGKRNYWTWNLYLNCFCHMDNLQYQTMPSYRYYQYRYLFCGSSCRYFESE